jgi:hypothetical protein
VLRGQIQSATTFAEEYCQSYDREGGRRSIQDAINDYNVEASERIRQLEQTVMDLLHIVRFPIIQCQPGELTKSRSLHGSQATRLTAQRALQPA